VRFLFERVAYCAASDATAKVGHEASVYPANTTATLIHVIRWLVAVGMVNIGVAPGTGTETPSLRNRSHAVQRAKAVQMTVDPPFPKQIDAGLSRFRIWKHHMEYSIIASVNEGCRRQRDFRS
jgi:hypothetical protein